MKNNEKKLIVLSELGKLIVGLGVSVNGFMLISKGCFFYRMFLGKLKLKFENSFFFLSVSNSFRSLSFFRFENLVEDDSFDSERSSFLFEDI